MFSHAMAEFGYDRIIFSVMRDDSLPPEHHRLGLAQNYPGDWQNFYVEKELHRIDPVLRLGQVQAEPFLWSTIGKRFELNRNQIKFMQMGQEAGLYHGVGIPLHLSPTARAGVALASSSGLERVYTDLDMLFAFALQFYRCFRGLFRRPAETVPIVPLSKREEQCLSFQIDGLRDAEIAEQLGLSLDTIKTVNRRILTKLERPTRTSAASRAILLNIVKK